MSSQNEKPAFDYLQLVYPTIYLIATIYNYFKGNMFFVYLWSALLIINVAYLLFSMYRKSKK